MEKLGQVEQAALDHNGWHAIAISKARHESGTVPSGVVAFVRQRAPFEDQRCGTARWAINDLGVTFYSGHYDMSRDDAMIDFAQRTLGYGAKVEA